MSTSRPSPAVAERLLDASRLSVVNFRDFACSAAAISNGQPAALRPSSCSVQTCAWKLKTFYASAMM